MTANSKAVPKPLPSNLETLALARTNGVFGRCCFRHRYNMLCGVLGGVGIVWVTVSERNEEDGEEEKEEEDRNAPNTRDSTDPDAVNANNNVSTCRLEGGTIDVNCCVADNDIVPRLSYSLDDDGDGDVSERGTSVQEPPVMVGEGAGSGCSWSSRRVGLTLRFVCSGCSGCGF